MHKIERREAVLGVCAILAATAFVYWKTLFGGCFFTNYDPVTQYYPMAEQYQRTPLSQLLWTPETGLGWPLFLSNYWTTFAPTNLVAFLLPVDARWLCDFMSWFYYAAAGILTFLCARRFKMSVPGALTASLIYLLANRVILIRYFIIMSGGLWLLPALLMVQSRTERGGIVPVALVVALGIFCSMPPMWLVMLAACTVFLVVRFWGTPVLLPAFLRWTVGVACGGALAAVQALPCYLLAKASGRYQDFPLALSVWPALRAVAGMFIAHFHPIQAVSLDEHTYVGVAALVLAAAVISRGPRPWQATFFLISTVLAFVFALGTSTPVWWLILRIPLVGIFGNPTRWTFIFAFSAAMAAGYGVDRLAAGDDPRRFLRRAALVGVVLYSLVWAGACVAYLGTIVADGKIRARGEARIDAMLGKPPHFQSRAYYQRKLDGMVRQLRSSVAPWNPRFWAPWCALGALLLVARRASAGKMSLRACAWAACAAAGLEVLLIQVPYCGEEVSGSDPPTGCHAASLLPKDGGLYRVYSFYAISTHHKLLHELGPMTPEERSRVYVQFFHEMLYPLTNMPRGISQFGNSLESIPRRESLLLEPLGWPRVFRGGQLIGYIWDSSLSPEQKAAKFLEHLRLAKVFNVRYVVSALPLEHPDLKSIDTHDVTLSARTEPVPIHLYEVLGCMPRAFVVPEARAIESDDEAVQALLEPEFDPRKTVLLSQEKKGTGTFCPPYGGQAGLPRSTRNGPEGASHKRCLSPFSPVEVVEYAPRRVRIKVRSDGHGYLVLGDAWSPEWTASTDGRPSTLYRANVACRAVRIEPGEHLVEFRHHARMVHGGLLLGGASAVVLCLLWAVGFIRSRKSAAAEPAP